MDEKKRNHRNQPIRENPLSKAMVHSVQSAEIGAKSIPKKSIWRSTEQHERTRMCARKKKGVSCEDGEHLKYDSTKVWIIDIPCLPNIPEGFERELRLRSDTSKIDVYYKTPNGKRMRSRTEIETFLEANKDYNYASPEAFDFKLPRMLKDTILDGTSDKIDPRAIQRK